MWMPEAAMNVVLTRQAAERALARGAREKSRGGGLE